MVYCYDNIRYIIILEINIKELLYVNKDTVMKKIKKNPMYIKYINNPDLEMQLQAVKEISYALKYIENPSIEVQKKAIIQNPYVIEYIEKPNDELINLALSIASNCKKVIK